MSADSDEGPVLLFPDGTRMEVGVCNTCGALVPVSGMGDHEAFHVVVGKSARNVLKNQPQSNAFSPCFYARATVDFTANQPGLTLFHCHIQAHMDYGFKALFRYN